MASTLRQALLPVVDALRGIPAQLGLRLYSVSVFSRTWSGTRVGIGESNDASSKLMVNLGTYDTKVQLVTARDVIASGGLYTDQDLKIGPITPPYTGSGKDNNDITVFDPTPNASPVEIFFRVTGPGFPAEGAWFKKISQNVMGNFRYTFVVRKTGEIVV